VTRIACAQIAPTVGNLKGNLELSGAAIAEAVAAGAEIVVLPELATSGYMFADADEARSVALNAVDPAFEAWRSVAGDAVVIGGYCELGDDGLLYNSALVLEAGGAIAS
jgi:predicted amidohydrolase